MDKLFVTIVLLTALIAGYVIYDTSKDVGVEIDRQAQTANVPWKKTATTSVILENVETKKPVLKHTETNKKINGNYVLSEVNGKKITLGEMYTISITDKKISGRICNSFSGEYVLIENVVAVDSLVSSKMACQGNPGEYENIFFRMIRSKPTFANKDGQMALTSGNNNMVFEHVYE